ncbi:MAG: CBS domain-containing protein [Candidatus Thermoplasmatota archaeon]
MQVSEIMTKNVVTIECDQTVVKACERYKQMGVGCLVVMKGNLIVGILTERDIIERVILEGRDPYTTSVDAIMTKNIKTIHASAPVEKAAEMMKKYRIKKLPVVLNNEIVGIVTVTDLANALPNVTKNMFRKQEPYKYIQITSESY